jgi:hypothetical protein
MRSPRKSVLLIYQMGMESIQAPEEAAASAVSDLVLSRMDCAASSAC